MNRRITPGRTSEELLEQFIKSRRLRRSIATYTSHVLSVPFIVKESDLIATVPYAVATRFTSLTKDLVAALPPFEITYELKMHWHRRFDNDPRSVWLREELMQAFKRRDWLEAPGGI